jgi:hypothetical protein
MAVTLNASTSSGLVLTPDTSGTVEIQSNGTTKLTVSSSGAYGQLVSDTAKSATSTSVDFTGIPSWVKRITVMFQGVSTNGTSNWLFQLGSGSATTSGYLGTGYRAANGGTWVNIAFTTGFGVPFDTASAVAHGSIVFANITGNSWVANGFLSRTDTTVTGGTGGSISLAGVLDRVRITTVNGTDTFDAGTINIMYEG